MAQRPTALCDGELIGIETIYTVIDGKQINIPEKLNELRKKSRENKLFCPCGCGANLILVAGERNLREQHFRIKDTERERECTFMSEGMVSVDSKVVLKCWLDDKLYASDVKSRVPIYAIDDINRKYEFSLLSREKKTAISYFYDRRNISNEKIELLDENSAGIKVIFISDCQNSGTNGQYPEAPMKIQGKQGYCLFLTINKRDYDKAELDAVYYDRDMDGLWQEIPIAEGLLRDYAIDDGNLTFKGNSLDDLKVSAEKAFSLSNENERRRREKAAEERRAALAEQERLRKERLQRQEEIRKQWEAEEKRLASERARLRREEIQKQEEIRRQKEAEEQRIAAEQEAKREEFFRILPELLEQQEEIVRDPDGARWIKCEFCGKIAKEGAFAYSGGVGKNNLGTCRECNRNNPDAQEEIYVPSPNLKRKKDSNRCPWCGGRLVERFGRFGPFLACEDRFCKYTRSK